MFRVDVDTTWFALVVKHTLMREIEIPFWFFGLYSLDDDLRSGPCGFGRGVNNCVASLSLLNPCSDSLLVGVLVLRRIFLIQLYDGIWMIGLNFVLTERLEVICLVQI